MKQTPIKLWEMPSSTNQAHKYKVAMYADSSFSCNCPRWTNKRPGQNRQCPHIISLQTVLRLTEIDAVIETGRAMPTAQRKITRLEE